MNSIVSVVVHCRSTMNKNGLKNFYSLIVVTRTDGRIDVECRGDKNTYENEYKKNVKDWIKETYLEEDLNCCSIHFINDLNEGVSFNPVKIEIDPIVITCGRCFK